MQARATIHHQPTLGGRGHVDRRRRFRATTGFTIPSPVLIEADTRAGTPSPPRDIDSVGGFSGDPVVGETPSGKFRFRWGKPPLKIVFSPPGNIFVLAVV